MEGEMDENQQSDIIEDSEDESKRYDDYIYQAKNKNYNSQTTSDPDVPVLKLGIDFDRKIDQIVESQVDRITELIVNGGGSASQFSGIHDSQMLN